MSGGSRAGAVVAVVLAACSSAAGVHDEGVTKARAGGGDVAQQAAVGPNGRYCPRDHTELRFAGAVATEDGGLRRFRMVQRAAAADGGVDVTQTFTFSAAGDGANETTEARHRLEPTDGALLIGVVPDALHEIPPPVRALPRPPRVGDAWSVPLAGRTVACRVEAVESAETFGGPRPRCAHVRMTDDATTTDCWYDAELGTVRLEVRRADGRLVRALAWCGDAWPSPDAVRRLFPPTANVRSAATPAR